jgi:hypothetical protein
MKKRKWFIYTVIIGLLPLMIRLFLYAVLNGLELSYVINEVDLVTFGLVLHISNINELEDKVNMDKVWKTTAIGISVIMLVLYSALLSIGYLSDAVDSVNINRRTLKMCAFLLSVLSFLNSYSIYNRLNKAEEWNG